MIVKNADDWCGCAPRGTNARCSFCKGPLRYPLLWWQPHTGRELRNCSQCRADDTVCCDACVVQHVYICMDCCSNNYDGAGLIRDVREMKTLREVKELGFHKAEPTKNDVFVPPQNVEQ